MTLQISNFHMTISGSRFLVPCPQGHVPHMGMLPVSDPVAIWSTTLGSRSPDFQNASGMFQTQMCDSQLPHLGLGIHGTNKGKDSRAKGESKTLIFTDQVCFNISMNLMFSLDFAFQTSLIWSVIIMARESYCLLSYSTHQNKDLKIP